MLHLKDPNNSTKTILDVINTLSKVAGHKINAKKSLAFLYVNNEQYEKEIMNTIPFTTASKIKILGNKFNEGSERPIQ
jgi:hypothetical protein